MNTDDDDSDDYNYNHVEMGSAKKILSSSAALGNYDRKFTKRVPLQHVEKEVDMLQEIMKIREDMRQWQRMQDEGKDEEESVLSTKRFDECDVSPLTVQALTEAGYVQMTTVQEATLCAFLEGKDALVKARAGTGKSIAFLVKQFYHVANHEQHIEIVYHLLKRHISEVPEYKIIVLCGTAMMTSLMFSLFREMKLNVQELHSKKPPVYRTRVCEEFKGAKQVILVTSDVSARGLNYPDVTLVVQVGIPPDRGQYIHRPGRTGRQGKDGEGRLLLVPWKQYFLDDIKDLPIEKLPSPKLDPDVNHKIQATMDKIDTSIKEAAYHAWLGYYSSINAIGRGQNNAGAVGQPICSIYRFTESACSLPENC